MVTNTNIHLQSSKKIYESGTVVTGKQKVN
jgi:hypothetical protein